MISSRAGAIGSQLSKLRGEKPFIRLRCCIVKGESVQLKIDKNNVWYASKMAGILSAHHSFKEA